MKNTANKLVVITGASSGFGLELAKELNKLGYPLLLLARRIEILDNLKLSNTLCAKVDVSNLEDFQNAIITAEKHFKLPVDCLVNNAGVMLLEFMDKQDPAEWQHMINVNIHGVLNGIHAVTKGMQQRKHGTIINIGSVSGKKVYPGASAYCATKFAVHALSEGVREELSPFNIRVINIAPGAAQTELLSHTTSEDIKNMRAKEMHKAMQANDVVRSIIFAYQQPQSVCIRELVLAATSQTR